MQVLESPSRQLTQPALWAWFLPAIAGAVVLPVVLNRGLLPPAALTALVLLQATVSLWLAKLLASGQMTRIGFSCAVFAYLQTVIYPWAFLFGGNVRYHFFAAAPEQAWVLATTVWFFSAVALVVGLGLSSKARFATPEFNAAPALAPTLALLAISAGGAVASVLLKGGIEGLRYGDLAADSVRTSRGLGILQPLTFCSYVAAAYAGWGIWEGSSRIRWLAVGALTLLLGGGPPLVYGRRGVVVYHAVLLVLPALFRRRPSRILGVLLAPCLVLVVIGDTMSAAIRQEYFRSGQLDWRVAWEPTNFSYVPLSHDALEMTAALLSHLDAKAFELRSGQTLIAGALNWLPRRVFPTKAWTGGPQLADALTQGYSFDDSRRSSSLVTGLVIEGVMNFGLLGAPFLTLLFGICAGLAERGVSSRAMRSSSGPLWSLVYLFVPFALIDDFGGFVTKLVSLTPGLLLLHLWLQRRPSPRTTTEWVARGSRLI